jgi:class 3 adenylate cyclase
MMHTPVWAASWRSLVTRLSGATVTLLFTDIEGSTRLLQKLSEAEYGVALGEHRRLLRAAVAEYGGQEVDCRADELFAVFDGAKSGVAAAAAGQRALAAQAWPKGAAVRVRMGLNAGEPLLAEGIYLGLDVNRAARICSAGHGGQVLVSQTARALVADGFEFRDLGEYRLAGLPAAERIFQLVIPGVRSEFPALRVTSPSTARRRRLRVRRRPRQPTLADAAWQARTLLPSVAEDARPALGELGASLFSGDRAAERADNFLSRVDHPKLASRLADQREMAVFSNRADNEAAAIQAQIAAVEIVADRRQALAESAVEMPELFGNPRAVTAAELDLLRERVAETTTRLDEAVSHAAATLDPLCFKLNRTRYRGIYQYGGRYLVPFVDDLGTDRERDFEKLSDARDFQTALRIAHKAQRRSSADDIVLPPDAGGGGVA